MSASALIDLSKIPAPNCVIPVGFQDELDELLNLYTEGMRDALDDPTFNAPLYADPAYQVLSTVAYRLGIKRQSINDACHGTMLAYAVNSDLDQIGATFGVLRLLITPEDNSVNPAIEAVYEDDARYRLRIQMALESWTTAGSRGSYEYAVLTANPHVVDVYIDRPRFERKTPEMLGLLPLVSQYPDDLSALNTLILLDCTYCARLENPIPGSVNITLLTDKFADQDQIYADINAALDRDEIIPMTDDPSLENAEIILYEVEAVLYFYPGPSAEPSLIAAELALREYTQNNYKLDHDIAVSGLHQAAHCEEVQRVALNIKNDIKVMPWQAAKCTGITVTMGGRDV